MGLIKSMRDIDYGASIFGLVGVWLIFAKFRPTTTLTQLRRPVLLVIVRCSQGGGGGVKGRAGELEMRKSISLIPPGSSNTRLSVAASLLVRRHLMRVLICINIFSKLPFFFPFIVPLRGIGGTLTHLNDRLVVFFHRSKLYL